jgi:predicted house-cleaning noncanonical NTP pyrophosphatase (MazG superfamily)
MKKLIRDRIPELAAASGRQLNIRVADETEFKALLREKLIEEALEVKGATDTELVEELADVLEVLAALCKAHGLEESVFEVGKKKAEERGVFDKRIVLEPEAKDV